MEKKEKVVIPLNKKMLLLLEYKKNIKMNFINKILN